MPLLNSEPRRMLVVAPHADDEVLGAGGLMARATAAGWKVHVAFATIAGYHSLARGLASTNADRVREVESALQVLGVQDYSVFRAGDRHHLLLDTVPQAELITFFEAQLESVQPSIAVIPSVHHHHQDHRAVATACAAALRPRPGSTVRVVLAYDHTSAGWVEGAAPPRVFVDISTVADLKLAALECYASQLCPPPHPRSLQTLRASWVMAGALAGVELAESFECLRVVVD